MSNIVIEVYAIESGLARTEKIAARGAELAPVAIDAVRVFASDAADRMVHAGKQVGARASPARGRGSGSAELIAARRRASGRRHGCRAPPNRRRGHPRRPASLLGENRGRRATLSGSSDQSTAVGCHQERESRRLP